MPRQIDDKHPDIDWSYTHDTNGFKTWREGPIAGAKSTYVLFNDHRVSFAIELKENYPYKLVVSNSGGWIIIPPDASEDLLDYIDQMYFAMSMTTNHKDELYIPRPNDVINFLNSQ